MIPLPAECELVELQIRGDDRGSLIAIENGSQIPFDVKRVYYIFGTTAGTSRGFHAHHDLRQFAICVAGSCVMTLDDGLQRYQVRLDRPDLGLQIGSPIWREMSEFSPDCVLLVLADAPYQDSDYIRDYADFQQIARKSAGDEA